jgi:cell shape-determining protein MreD
MTLKILFNILLLLALSVFQISFINNLSPYFSYLNLALIIILFILEFRGLNAALFWALGIGIIFDLLSFNFFGLHIIVFSVSTYLIHLVLLNFFTDFSIYSISMLIVFYLFVYEIILRVLIGAVKLDIGYLFLFFKLEFLEYFILKISINLLLVFLIFHIVNFFNNKFSPVFLNKKL